MKDPIDAFRQFLAGKNQKLTPQRQVVLRIFMDHHGHMTPEELHQLARDMDPGLGLATVYRTLKLLEEAGLARELRLGDGVARYEYDYGRAHHDHIICTACSRNIEVLDPRIEALQEALARRHGFELTGHKMLLYGLCETCRASAQKDRQGDA